LNERTLRIALLTILLAILISLEVLDYKEVHSLDLIIYNALCDKLNMYFMEIISLTASLEAFILYVVFLIIKDLYEEKNLSKETIGVITALFISMVAVFVLKVSLRIPRPLGTLSPKSSFSKALREADTFSFPSGHVTRSTVLAAYLESRSKRILSVLLWVWTLGVLVSRLALGAHWFMDVIAALVIGILSVELVKLWEKDIYAFYLKLLRILR
jgi:undecaprenyl-diphosphatase